MREVGEEVETSAHNYCKKLTCREMEENKVEDGENYA